MGDIFKGIGAAASILVPGAAPIVAAASGLVSALQGPAAPQGGAPAAAPVDQTSYLGGRMGFRYPSRWVAPTRRLGPGEVGILGVSQDGEGGMFSGPPLLGPPDMETAIAAGPLEAPRQWLPSVATGAPLPFDPVASVLGGTGLLGSAGFAGTIGEVGRTMLGGFGLGGGGARGLIAAAERVLPKILLGTSAGAAIYELYARLRGAGHGHKRARRLALQASGVMLRRRRMRPTNVHALRRAIRRVHGFQRIARKVGALHVGRRRLLAAPRYGRRRMYRRGDVSPFMVEDWVDEVDEAEDLGLEPDQFREAVAE